MTRLCLLSLLTLTLSIALADAGLPNGDGPVAAVGKLQLAGVDFPSEEAEMQAAATDRLRI